MPPQSKAEIAALTAKWYAKLKKDGFEDAETSGGQLRQYHSYELFKDYRGNSKVCREAKEEYYQRAEHMLNDYPFASKLEKAIWELHVQGISNIEITTALKKRRFKIYRDKVQRIVMALAKEMLKNDTR